MKGCIFGTQANILYQKVESARTGASARCCKPEIGPRRLIFALETSRLKHMFNGSSKRKAHKAYLKMVAQHINANWCTLMKDLYVAKLKKQRLGKAVIILQRLGCLLTS